jgi:hypothetical protein
VTHQANGRLRYRFAFRRTALPCQAAIGIHPNDTTRDSSDVTSAGQGERRESYAVASTLSLAFPLQISDYMRHTATRTETRESRFKSVPGQPALVLDDARLVLCTLVLTVTRQDTHTRQGTGASGH